MKKTVFGARQDLEGFYRATKEVQDAKTPEQRRVAKAKNLGALYGMGPRPFAEVLKKEKK